jgi:ketosteroid isomerase-like protein
MNGSTETKNGSMLAALRQALERRDVDALAELYADDAVLEEVSPLSPPAHPTVTRGRENIKKRLRHDIQRDPLGGWKREVRSSALLDAIETDEAVAFTELRTYEAGDKVIAQHLAEKRDGRIGRDRMVVVWDPE